MQDFVRVSVADTAQDVWIRERTLECVVVRSKSCRKRGEVCLQNIEAAGVEPFEIRLAAHHMQRRATPRAGLGENELSAAEFEDSQTPARRDLGPGRNPQQPAR